MTSHLFSFVGGNTGRWRIATLAPVVGAPLESAPYLDIVEANITTLQPGTAWILRGVTSYERYVTSAEHHSLTDRQPSLDRSQATCAALIPVKKSAQWWALPQDERRAIFEEQSHHIQTGLRYLPAVARRLHHSHDLGEPFDFLTWFEYAPQDAEAFEELTRTLRATAEWAYVEREFDIRLTRE